MSTHDTDTGTARHRANTYPATTRTGVSTESVTTADLSQALRLERLVAPYAVTVNDLSGETLRASLSLDLERQRERTFLAPRVTRSPLTGHVLHAIYWSRHWRVYYTVTAIDERGFVTVRWHERSPGMFSPLEESTHCTHVRNDELVGSRGWWQ